MVFTEIETELNKKEKNENIIQLKLTNLNK